MRIGLLTLPIAENYGGILQAVALYQFLSKEGHDVTLIYKQNDQQGKVLKEIARYILLSLPAHNLFNVKTNFQAMKGIKERTALHKSFIHNEIPNISPPLITTQELANYTNEQKFDAVVVGSDQVWRKAYINDRYYQSYFLDFIPPNSKIKKIAYAASFGKDTWEGKGDEEQISELLRQFSGISVREASGIDVCRAVFNIKNVEHVLDPTLLMDKEFYLDIIRKYDVSNMPVKKMVTYVLDEAKDKRTIINNYQQSLNINENETLHLKGFSQLNRAAYSVPEWLFAIANADFVITDSFHGMVFSIIFEKQFIVIGNKNRGLERFTSLLSYLALENNLIVSERESRKSIVKIDQKNIKFKIQSLHIDSVDFLEKILSYSCHNVEKELMS
ncbi:polysaccharide pyruvyl transferase family protein [Wohlfahrtiimonas chitiniclastica]|uniref:polysaccharide pyruvyl transferase family protein n=1 Tax=Wohlfahrtiimonas chitiniclastica TaxID=400946 RepID=UPI001BD05917|nr:polysaccharide pyruvyl transferase family protein [Wohlfahrtiimonas chitiniclastica]